MKKIMLISGAAIMIYLSFQVCGCGSCEAKTTNIETTVSIKKETKTVKLKITGMTCAGCSNHVTQTLEGVKWVSKVDLEYPGDMATVVYDPKVTNVKEIITAVEKINYKAEEIKTKK